MDRELFKIGSRIQINAGFLLELKLYEPELTWPTCNGTIIDMKDSCMFTTWDDGQGPIKFSYKILDLVLA